MTDYKLVQAELIDWLTQNEEKVLDGTFPKFHAILADPPYALPGGFMNKKWDQFSSPQAYQAWVTEWASLLLKFVYPGAVGMFFGGTRTVHRLTSGLEDAGWEVFDTCLYLYGTGFPKSHDISKAIDREAGAEREVVGRKYQGNGNGSIGKTYGDYTAGHEGVLVTAPATPDAVRWSGYGTALKPSFEPIVCARAPRDGTYAQCATRYGTSALNVDGARIGTADDMNPRDFDDTRRTSPKFSGTFNGGKVGEYLSSPGVVPDGRWPANTLLVCGCDGAHEPGCPVRVLDEQSGESVSRGGRIGNKDGGIAVPGGRYEKGDPGYGDSGGASRFFYTAKASTWERTAGMDERSNHPTVKPVDLTRYLATMLLPPELDESRRILVPFAGIGSEMLGAILAGWDSVVGIEQSEDYITQAHKRLAWWSQFDSIEAAKKAYQQEQKRAKEVVEWFTS